MWPETLWENITGQYAGLFFRAEGQKSAGFGQTQEHQTQSIHVHVLTFPWGKPFNWGFIIGEKYNELPLWSGNDQGDGIGLFFRHTSDEIRPRNQAIRIWKRIK